MRVLDQRVPVAPLLPHLRAWLEANPIAGTNGQEYIPRPFPGQVALNKRYWDAMVSGTVTLYTADRMACAIGMHPAEIWGDAWWDHAEVEPARGVG